MVVIFLGDFASVCVELDDFLVGHTGEEFVVEVRVGVEADDVGDFAGREAFDAFSGFSVPELNVTVVGGGDEMCTRVVEAEVGDGFGVADKGAEEWAAFVVEVPELDFVVGATGEEEMTAAREEAEDGDGFVVGVFPFMNTLFWNIACLLSRFLVQPDARYISRNVHICPSHIVVKLCAVECRPLFSFVNI